MKSLPAASDTLPATPEALSIVNEALPAPSEVLYEYLSPSFVLVIFPSGAEATADHVTLLRLFTLANPGESRVGARAGQEQEPYYSPNTRFHPNWV